MGGDGDDVLSGDCMNSKVCMYYTVQYSKCTCESFLNAAFYYVCYCKTCLTSINCSLLIYWTGTAGLEEYLFLPLA